MYPPGSAPLWKKRYETSCRITRLIKQGQNEVLQQASNKKKILNFISPFVKFVCKSFVVLVDHGIFCWLYQQIYIWLRLYFDSIIVFRNLYLLQTCLELMILLAPNDDENRLLLSRIYLHQGINLEEVEYCFCITHSCVTYLFSWTCADSTFEVRSYLSHILEERFKKDRVY